MRYVIIQTRLLRVANQSLELKDMFEIAALKKNIRKAH